MYEFILVKKNRLENSNLRAELDVGWVFFHFVSGTKTVNHFLYNTYVVSMY